MVSQQRLVLKVELTEILINPAWHMHMRMYLPVYIKHIILPAPTNKNISKLILALITII